MENFLSDQSKFQKIALKDDTFLNFIISQEKRIDKIYKRFVDSNLMSEETRKHRKLVGILAKSKGVDGCPPFRSILSALRAPTCKLAKYLVLILDPLTNKKNTQSKILLTLPLKLSNMIPATSWEA